MLVSRAATRADREFCASFLDIIDTIYRGLTRLRAFDTRG